jgi:hypothetical protein
VSPPKRPPVSYANAQVRGQLRQWKAALAQQYLVFERAYRRRSEWDPIVQDLVRRSSDTGRRRAFGKLAQLSGPAAILEGLRLDGPHPLAVWSLLKPRDSVVVDANPESGRAQDCVSVNYLVAGTVADTIGIAEGLWTLEVPDHALGRAVEYSGMLPGSIIRDAHHNLLRLRTLQVVNGSKPKQFLLRAGGGGFVCELHCGEDVSIGGELSCYAFVRTWLDDDRLHDDQVTLVDDGAPGERLGDTFLLPAPFRRLVRTGEGVQCAVHVSGLPDLLAKPQGRA